MIFFMNKLKFKKLVKKFKIVNNIWKFKLTDENLVLKV